MLSVKKVEAVRNISQYPLAFPAADALDLVVPLQVVVTLILAEPFNLGSLVQGNAIVGGFLFIVCTYRCNIHTWNIIGYFYMITSALICMPIPPNLSHLVHALPDADLIYISFLPYGIAI